MIEMQVQYSFNPVGQGLFSSGRLNVTQHGRNLESDFQWVCDCGTTSSQRLIKNALVQFKHRQNEQRLDLVIISHFDTDHISGIVALLNEVGTHTLMLPWAPLWHRLVIAYAQGITPEDAEFGFYIDPIQYLSDQADGGFERIVFVPFSDGEGPPEPEGGGEPTIGPEGDLLMKIEPEERERREDDDAGMMEEWRSYTINSVHRAKMMMMRRGTAVSVSGLWEFVPYNDPATRPKNEEEFVRRVDELRSALLNSSNEKREDALAELKQHYVRTFPKSQLNDLSLFVFGGPIGIWQTPHGWDGHRPWRFNVGDDTYSGSFLHTGDGDLSSLQKWQSLSAYLRPARAFRPSIFQVPHHGSKYNWFDGLGAIVEPCFSVFSSDPAHRSYGHPHVEVLRDLWQFRPIQVDKESSFWIQVRLYQ